MLYTSRVMYCMVSSLLGVFFLCNGLIKNNNDLENKRHIVLVFEGLHVGFTRDIPVLLQSVVSESEKR